ncbi:MAG: hypothetical protein GY842_20435 [bacterium]|nr:hypothetical protein [bacterium]
MSTVQSETKARPEKHAPTGLEHELPAGDSSPRPAWPMVLVGGMWVLWVGFLVAMMVIRMRTTAV